jgi:hypothetical protein
LPPGGCNADLDIPVLGSTGVGALPLRDARRAARDVDVPSPCGHAGGLAVGGDGMLYVADTHTLFATPLARAFDRGARFRQFSLGPGVIGGLAASTPDGIWLGTYEEGPGRLFRFTAATLARLSDGQTLEASQAATVLTIPDHAQGAGNRRRGAMDRA